MSNTYERKDRLYQQAKEQGYRSRAAYKLDELNKKRKFLHKGTRVLDLGCFPGGWLQVALEKIGPTGVVIGVDLREVKPVVSSTGNKAHILLGDINDPCIQEAIRKEADGLVDVLLSDMSPQLSGIRFADVARSASLVEQAYLTAVSVLRDGGVFVAKIFPGEEADELFDEIRPQFKKLERIVLKSTRKSSNELYLFGAGFHRHAAVSKLNQRNQPDCGWSPI